MFKEREMKWFKYLSNVDSNLHIKLVLVGCYNERVCLSISNLKDHMPEYLI